MSTPSTEEQAKAMFERQSKAWTGHVWDWDKAGEEVRQRFIKHVVDGTRPLAKEDS